MFVRAVADNPPVFHFKGRFAFVSPENRDGARQGTMTFDRVQWSKILASPGYFGRFAIYCDAAA